MCCEAVTDTNMRCSKRIGSIFLSSLNQPSHCALLWPVLLISNVAKNSQINLFTFKDIKFFFFFSLLSVINVINTFCALFKKKKTNYLEVK